MKHEVQHWLERRTNKTNLRREEKEGKASKKNFQRPTIHFLNMPVNLLKPGNHWLND
jgi:hypothetical protein